MSDYLEDTQLGKNQTVELDESEWIKVRSVMEYGIERLHDEDLHRVAKSRQRLLDNITAQTEVYEPTSLAGLVEKLEDECGIEKSRNVEETGRTVANLQD